MDDDLLLDMLQFIDRRQRKGKNVIAWIDLSCKRGLCSNSENEIIKNTESAILTELDKLGCHLLQKWENDNVESD